MRKIWCFVAVAMGAAMLFAVQVQAQHLQKADEAYAKGDMQNLEKAIELYEQALQESPESFEANWKLARAYRDYA
ncbi:MAG: tetratricopeptide repeat protein, partial [Desulfohalobiaceae bacterium]